MLTRQNNLMPLQRDRVTDDGFQYTFSLWATDETPARYSVSVKLTCPDGMKSEQCLDGVFTNRERAFSFFLLIKKNLVTPQNLIYVFEDEYMS